MSITFSAHFDGHVIVPDTQPCCCPLGNSTCAVSNPLDLNRVSLPIWQRIFWGRAARFAR